MKFADIAEQFHSANKLPHIDWLFPNAPIDHESMTTAWYTPTPFSPIPTGRSSSSSNSSLPDPCEEEAEVDTPGILKSVEYVRELIGAEVTRGVSLDRIVLGGFSQGCAISLVTGLSERYRGKLGGIVGLSGYLPLSGKVLGEWEPEEDRNGINVFLAHGTKDALVPVRVFREYAEKLKATVGEGVEIRSYEGMGHATSGAEFRDMCSFLEKILPGK